jgi:hypothetical protein
VLLHVRIVSQSDSGVPLGVQIDQQYLFLLFSKGGGQIHGRSGLAAAPFLIDNCNYSLVQYYCNIPLDMITESCSIVLSWNPSIRRMTFVFEPSQPFAKEWQ